MAKFHGFIGFTETVEISPGTFKEQSTEHEYVGEFLRAGIAVQGSENLNDNVKLNVRISIIADPYTFANLSNIRYVKWAGVSWKVSNIEPERPRLILTVGEVYNG